MDARWNSNFRTDVGGGYRVGIKADFSAGLGPPEGGFPELADGVCRSPSGPEAGDCPRALLFSAGTPAHLAGSFGPV